MNPILIFFYIIALFLPKNQPEELGKVNWNRDYQEALILSKKTGKPVFILFQEIPGCSTCKNYGNNILTHPFIVEAIEDHFIPLAVYNNKGGKDAEVLRLYGEPSWNNPVVRIVDQEGQNLVKRLSGDYSLLAVTNTLINGMLKTNQIVPKYLHLFAEELELNAGELKESYVSMYCFWTGEKVIGNIKGVTETEAGYMDGKEVVRFKYNPDAVAYVDIIAEASKMQCADGAYTNDEKEYDVASKLLKSNSKKLKAYKQDRDPKYYIQNTNYQYLPMTALQAQRVNTALGSNQNPDEFLSPRQLDLMEYVSSHRNQKWDNVVGKDFTTAWWETGISIKS
jgi:hypothetical protein